MEDLDLCTQKENHALHFHLAQQLLKLCDWEIEVWVMNIVLGIPLDNYSFL